MVLPKTSYFFVKVFKVKDRYPLLSKKKDVLHV